MQSRMFLAITKVHQKVRTQGPMQSRMSPTIVGGHQKVRAKGLRKEV